MRIIDLSRGVTTVSATLSFGSGAGVLVLRALAGVLYCGSPLATVATISQPLNHAALRGLLLTPAGGEGVETRDTA